MSITRENVKLRQEIKQVEAIQGRHTELCSIFIPSHKQSSEVLRYLANEVVESNNIKDKVNRKVVQRSIVTAMS
jgi:peptide subunit release factor 1 (eRF1)